MANNLIYSEFFDKYLKDKLSENERIAFEEKVNQDPLLRSELKMQSDIYVALGETRKAALKSRLDQIPVNNLGWFTSQGARMAMVIGSAFVVTVGSYFYFSSVNHDKQWQPHVNIDPAFTVTDQIKEKLSAPVPVLKPDHQLKKPSANPVADELVVASGKASKKQIFTKQTEAESIPDIKRPELITDFEEDTQKINYNDFEAPQEKIVENTVVDNANIDIENVVNQQYNFHYQFIDNKLYLYGNFSSTPYKIIALNFDQNRKLFLEYNDHFYGIDSQQKAIAPLQAIEDTVLLKELKKIHVSN